MADRTGGGVADGALGPAARARAALRTMAAAASLALVLGVGVWGYRLLAREAAGLPVVEAEDGPMRVAPAEPGGAVAAHQGLAVNAVAAQGEAAPPSDVLLLAPAAGGLAPEDLEVGPTAEAGDPMPLDPAQLDAAPPAPAASSEGTTPGGTTPGEPSAPPPGAPAGPASPDGPAPSTLAAAGPPEAAGPPAAAELPAAPPVAAPIPADVPGLALAVRPPARAGSAAPPPSEASPAAPAPVLPVALTADLPPGTSLVQLGAFESPEVAAAEWGRLQARFGELLGAKERVVQEARQGGDTFFRLRAMGFQDLADARRFCAALVAEDAGCVPVLAD